MQHFHFPRRAAVLTAALAVLAGAGTIATAVATASPSVSFTLYANGTSKAAFNSAGAAVLTSGSTAGDSAQIQVVNPPAAAPTMAPTFTATPQDAGNPRWVIEFHNGCYLFGYGTSGTSSSVTTWVENPGGATAASYSAAVTWATGGGCGLDNQVTAAFIVMDGGNPGVPVALTKVSYDGVTLTAPPPPALVKIPVVTGMRASAALTAIRAAGFQAVTSPLRNPRYTYVATGTTPTGSAPKGSLVVVHVKVG